MLVLLLLAVGGYVAFQSSYVQTKVTQRLARYLSKELNATVSVGGVDLELVKTLVLEGVYVEDQQGDTLLYLGDIKGDINSYNLNDAYFDIETLYLGDGVVYLADRGDGLNLDFLIDYFRSDSPSDSPAPELHCGELVLHNVAFRYDVDAEAPEPMGMD